MSLFSRYGCRSFVTYFAASLGLCTALFLVVEIFDRIDEFIERQVLWYDAARYLAFKLPGILYQMAPVGCLLASLSQAHLVPYTNHTASLIWRTRVRHTKMALGQGLFQRGHIWYRNAERIWSIKRGLPLEQRLLNVTIFELDDTGRVRQRYDAAEARWDTDGWTLHQGQRHAFDEEGYFAASPEVFSVRRVDFTERAEDIGAVRKEPDEMSLQESLAHARRLRQQGVPDRLYRVAFHGKIAFAAVGILMACFGLPLALLSNRSGGMIRAVALTLAAGFSYWILHSLAMALGANGQLPPLLAAWSANGCFAAGSVIMASRVR